MRGAIRGGGRGMCMPGGEIRRALLLLVRCPKDVQSPVFMPIDYGIQVVVMPHE